MNYDFGIAYVRQDEHAVKVTLSSFRGKNYIHIREYIYDLDEEVWFPTKKGYALIAEEVDSVIELLQKASNQLAIEYKPSEQLELNFEE